MFYPLTIFLGFVVMTMTSPIDTVPPSPAAVAEEANFEASERAIPDRATWTYVDPQNGRTIVYAVTTVPTRTLDDAKNTCQNAAWRLATIVTQGQLQFLQTNLKAFVAGASHKSNRAAFWIGATDLIINSSPGQGQYWFYTGENVNPTFWNVGEPNDYQTGTDRPPETCVDLKVPASDPTADFGVNDEVCTTEISYICQFGS